MCQKLKNLIMEQKKKYLEWAEKADHDDMLKEYRNLFIKHDKRLIYFDGNSLGMLPKEAKIIAEKVITEEWGKRLIRGWNESWWEMPERVAAKISKIIGAEENEVIVCDSTSVNLFKLLSAALKMRPNRRKILSDNLNFPSDLYIIEGIIAGSDNNLRLELVQSSDDITIGYNELDKLIDEDTAVVVLSLVSFRSSYMFDMKRVTKLAQQKGALVIWDLSHAAGAVEINMKEANADMAVGCTYKYLNGGPGSPAYLYLREDLQKEAVSPVWGWLGEKSPFEFSMEYRPSNGIRHYMTGSPNILSMCTLEPALDIVLNAGLKRIREKSVAMTGFMLKLFHELLEPLGFKSGSPDNCNERGSHISIRHHDGLRICKALIDEKQGNFVIIPDFRPPDNIRLGLTPLYNSFTEICEVMYEIERIIREKLYLNYNSTSDNVS